MQLEEAEAEWLKPVPPPAHATQTAALPLPPPEWAEVQRGTRTVTICARELALLLPKPQLERPLPTVHLRCLGSLGLRMDSDLPAAAIYSAFHCPNSIPAPPSPHAAALPA